MSRKQMRIVMAKRMEKAFMMGKLYLSNEGLALVQKAQNKEVK